MSQGLCKHLSRALWVLDLPVSEEGTAQLCQLPVATWTFTPGCSFTIVSIHVLQDLSSASAALHTWLSALLCSQNLTKWANNILVLILPMRKLGFAEVR